MGPKTQTGLHPRDHMYNDLMRFKAPLTRCAMILLLGTIAAAVPSQSHAVTTQPTGAAELYIKAARQIKSESPSSSSLDYPEYPPYPDAWKKLAKAAWDSNAPTRELAREARSIDRAIWPPDTEVGCLNLMRALANDLADASLYQHTQGDDAGAFETIQDLLHLTDALAAKPETLLRHLTSIGILALADNRLLVITSGVTLTNDPNDSKNLQVAVARKLIGTLLKTRVPDTSPAWQIDPENLDRILETWNRVNAECAFAAMSLASHLFRFEKGHWPASLDELIPVYLPHAPNDPWGDGKQALGYVLIKHGLADGSDRPLVYSRCQSQDGMMYRTDKPQYSYYARDGSDRPSVQQQHAGQFRDVARWLPKSVSPPSWQATLQPLP